MKRVRHIALGIMLLTTVAVSSCTSATPTPSVQPTATSALQPVTTELPPTSTAAPEPTSTATIAPTAAPTRTATPQPTAANPGYIPYLDDRSDAMAVMRSLFNAINLHQYVRAYAYWDDTPERVPFDQFEAGYQDTASVQVTFGVSGLGAGAGNLYASIPVMLNAIATTGATQTYVGCYLLHLGQPANQGALPFRPWGIQAANVTEVDNGTNTADLMSHACDQYGAPPAPQLQPTADPSDISANQYLDNRSDPVAVLRSLYNAINRHEYVRAYSYWKSTASNLPTLDQFTQGYSATAAVTIAFGTVTPDVGAGQFRYSVPTTLVAQQTDGTRQTFVGCYTLHIANPDIQAVPPFQPLAIESANVKQVANEADIATLMNQMCGIP